MKRRYPFSESVCHQIKCHISEKEVNNGVSAKENMKAVYDKTLSLLFRGANKAKDVDSQPDPSKTTAQFESRSHVSTRQMRLEWTSSGHLHLNGQNNNWSEPSTSWAPPPNQPQPTCYACRNMKPENKKLCDFCESRICGSCLRCCHQCQKDFCQLCAIPIYNLQEEMAICLSCLS